MKPVAIVMLLLTSAFWLIKDNRKDKVSDIWVILRCVAGGGGIIISSCLVRAALHAHSVTREYTEYTSKLYIT